MFIWHKVDHKTQKNFKGETAEINLNIASSALSHTGVPCTCVCLIYTTDDSNIQRCVINIVNNIHSRMTECVKRIFKSKNWARESYYIYIPPPPILFLLLPFKSILSFLWIVYWTIIILPKRNICYIWR